MIWWLGIEYDTPENGNAPPTFSFVLFSITSFVI